MFPPTLKSSVFESLQVVGFPGAPLFILFLGFFGRKSFRNPGKQADFILFWSAQGSRFSGYTTFPMCTELQNKIDFSGCSLHFFTTLYLFLRAPHMSYYNGILWLLPALTAFADVVISHSHFGFWRTVAPRISEKPKSKTFV